MTKKGITSAIKELKTTIILKNSGFAIIVTQCMILKHPENIKPCNDII